MTELPLSLDGLNKINKNKTCEYTACIPHKIISTNISTNIPFSWSDYAKPGLFPYTRLMNLLMLT